VEAHVASPGIVVGDRPAWPLVSESRAWRRFRRDPGAVLALLAVTVVAALAVLGPSIAPYSPNAQVLSERRRPPSAAHALGQDEFGRDIASRMLHGTRATLLSCLGAVSVALLIGAAGGLVSGYSGGATDQAVMRVTDVLLAFPYFALTILVVAALGRGLAPAALAVGLANVPSFARLMRGSVLALKEEEYVLAARALGCPPPVLLARHILPNVIAPIIVMATNALAVAVLAVAGLGFLGLGAQAPQAEWGAMVGAGRSYIDTAPHIAGVPGLAISILVLSFNVLGDGLRDALDPRADD
jgi:ABC-type dipeptide/oligopeptide/nickel transport system permease subunit